MQSFSQSLQPLFSTPQGTYQLDRLPFTTSKSLQAWNSADEYLLRVLDEQDLLFDGIRILILNDSFGALSVALHGYKPLSITDSWLSQQATSLNLELNQISSDSVTLRNSLDWPSQSFDLVLIKIPKTLALLEDQLIRLRPLLHSETTVLASAMVKNLSENAWKLMDRYLGKTRPSLTWKKARLIYTELCFPYQILPNPYPVSYQLEQSDYRIVNHANVFSRDKLDIGTRFFIQHLPKTDKPFQCVDLGCGNGVVGLVLAEQCPKAYLNFVDESYMAIASAKENFQNAFPGRQANFFIADCLMDFKTSSMDLIVCNPPFHQQHTIGSFIALNMFRQSWSVLRVGGQLIVIGNQHLGYHKVLKNIFGHCHVLAANEKFVILNSVKK